METGARRAEKGPVTTAMVNGIALKNCFVV